MKRMYLSAPDVGTLEAKMILEAIESNWVAPVGPDLDAFESEVAHLSGRKYAVGLSSGTAALHLALKELGVSAGDDVLVSSFTFAAPAYAVVYLGARPVFIDSSADTWNLSPELVAEELAVRAKQSNLPRAAVAVDLYGQCAEYDVLLPMFSDYGIPVVEDSAEALGASYSNRPAGSFGHVGIFSFNGNKIITTSGGGMLVTDSWQIASRARYLSTQARDDAAHYEHSEIGFNYRLSNLLAAFGRAQLADLRRRVDRRREINKRYRSALAHVPGVDFMPLAPNGRSTCWLTCITIDSTVTGHTREELRLHLDAHDIEARPAWKPMHLQPVFREASRRVDGTSERIFETGLCLPSGSAMTDEDQDRVVELLLERLAH